jgi:hypothetical protein
MKIIALEEINKFVILSFFHEIIPYLALKNFSIPFLALENFSFPIWP